MDYNSTLKYRKQEYVDLGKLKISLKDIYKAIERNDLRELLDEVEHWAMCSIADKFHRISVNCELHVRKSWFMDFLNKKNEGIVYLTGVENKYRIVFEIKEKWYSKRRYVEVTLEYLNSKITIQ